MSFRKKTIDNLRIYLIWYIEHFILSSFSFMITYWDILFLFSDSVGIETVWKITFFQLNGCKEVELPVYAYLYTP